MGTIGMVEVELPRGEQVMVPVGAREVLLPGGRILRAEWSAAQLASYTVEPDTTASPERCRVVWSAREGQIEPIPRHGALLRYRPAIERESTDTWHPSVEAALADLRELGERYGIHPDGDGMSFDFSALGCSPSWADVVPLGLQTTAAEDA